MEYINITFPGGKRVTSHVNEFTIETDQSIQGGGENTAPSPMDLFLSSIATCVGMCALGFCKSRNIDTKGMKLALCLKKEDKKIKEINLKLTRPASFPKKYERVIIDAINQCCTVKKYIYNPPVISTSLI
ncbi:OsmC family protein [Mycoplasmatota bacterium]|nr:OsmC family protein [Mycoplasmatota bacterium]